MKKIIDDFFSSYFKRDDFFSVYDDEKTPKDMMVSSVRKSGWYTWKPIKGTLTEEDYHKVEQRFGVKFPKSFIDWHKQYFFLGCSCEIMGLPISSPTEPLQNIIDNLDYSLATELIEAKLYPFGDEGSDAGPLVFDALHEVADNEFPIRMYDHDYAGGIEGLSEIIFSSFLKLLECFTHFIKELSARKNYEIIPDFFQIDPDGAGKTGLAYWSEWIAIMKWNDENSPLV